MTGPPMTSTSRRRTIASIVRSCSAALHAEANWLDATAEQAKGGRNCGADGRCRPSEAKGEDEGSSDDGTDAEDGDDAGGAGSSRRGGDADMMDADSLREAEVDEDWPMVSRGRGRRK